MRGAGWTRYRFKADEADPRPIVFPPPGPYWITGFGEDHSIVVAYLPPDVALTDFWPEADDVDAKLEAELEYTERFPKPEWYEGSDA